MKDTGLILQRRGIVADAPNTFETVCWHWDVTDENGSTYAHTHRLEGLPDGSGWRDICCPDDRRSACD